MKKFSLALFFVVVSFFSKAQWVSIPDTAFVNVLQNNVPSCMNGNQLDTTCPTLQQLIGFTCGSHKGITNVEGIQYFKALQTFNCQDNNIAQLTPNLPPALVYLVCSNNPLSAFPALPSTLRGLYFYDCQFASLPNLPDSLIYLTCSGNPLTSLPALPSTLKELYCGSTNISALPILPAKMAIINCPATPSLSFIPNFPDSVTNTVDIKNNPNLACLPKLGFINNFYFNNTPITCLPNYSNVLNSQPSVAAIPLCEPANPNDCAIYWNMRGRVYTDADTNCSFNGTDAGQINVKQELWSNGMLLQQTYTRNYGLFAFDTSGVGNYEVRSDTTNFAFRLLCPGNGVYYDTITATDSLFYDNDFAYKCKHGFDLVAWSVSSQNVFRPGGNTEIEIHTGDLANFNNGHCAAGVAGVVKVTINGPASYLEPKAGAIAPDSVVNNIVTWKVTDFENVNFNTDFGIVLYTDTLAQIGQQVCFTIEVTTASQDNDTSNNTLHHCFDIVSSFDPNDKQVSPVSNIYAQQDWLIYTVRFQNTGTAEAQHIYVTDTLDNNLDVGTFQLLAYSHQPAVQLKQNAIRFNFPNINLPDSNTNEPASHGYVQYKVKLNGNLPVGTVINNTAFIYFDLNAAVITNTTTNTIIAETAIANIKLQNSNFKLFPNPANTELFIQTQNFNPLFIAISDINGKKIILQKYAPQIDVSNLASGSYFIELKGSDAISRKRFVKL